MADYQGRIELIVSGMRQLDQLENVLNGIEEAAAGVQERIRGAAQEVQSAARGTGRAGRGRSRAEAALLGAGERFAWVRQRRDPRSGRFLPNARGVTVEGRRAARQQLLAAAAEFRAARAAELAAQADERVARDRLAVVTQEGRLLQRRRDQVQGAQRRTLERTDQAARRATRAAEQETAATRVSRGLRTVQRVRPAPESLLTRTGRPRPEAARVNQLNARIEQIQQLADVLIPRAIADIATPAQTSLLKRLGTELLSIGEEFREFDRLLNLRSDTFQKTREQLVKANKIFESSPSNPAGSGRRLSGTTLEQVRTLAGQANTAAIAGDKQEVERLTKLIANRLKNAQTVLDLERDEIRERESQVRANERLTANTVALNEQRKKALLTTAQQSSVAKENFRRIETLQRSGTVSDPRLQRLTQQAQSVRSLVGASDNATFRTAQIQLLDALKPLEKRSREASRSFTDLERATSKVEDSLSRWAEIDREGGRELAKAESMAAKEVARRAEAERSQTEDLKAARKFELRNFNEKVKESQRRRGLRQAALPIGGTGTTVGSPKWIKAQEDIITANIKQMERYLKPLEELESNSKELAAAQKMAATEIRERVLPEIKRENAERKLRTDIEGRNFKERLKQAQAVKPIEERARTGVDVLGSQLGRVRSLTARAQTLQSRGQLQPTTELSAIEALETQLSTIYEQRRSRIKAIGKQTGVKITEDFVDGLENAADQVAEKIVEIDLLLKKAALNPVVKQPSAAGAAQGISAAGAADIARGAEARSVIIEQQLQQLKERGLVTDREEVRLQEILNRLKQAEAALDKKELTTASRELNTLKSTVAAQERATRPVPTKSAGVADLPFDFKKAGREMGREFGLFLNTFTKRQGAGLFSKALPPGLGRRSVASAGKGILSNEQFANAALGAGFPLLFGGGAGSVIGSVIGTGLGGVLGGGAGGFAGQILGGALGAQLEALVGASRELRDAMLATTDSFQGLREAGLLVAAASEQQYLELKKAGDFQGAENVATAQLLQIGDVGGVGTQIAGDSVKALQQAWDGVYKTIATTLGLLSSGVILALAAILRIVQAIFVVANAVLTGIIRLLTLIPGVQQLFDILEGLVNLGDPAAQERLVNLQKEIDSRKTALGIAKELADLEVRAANLPGPFKTRAEFEIRERQRALELQKELREINATNPTNTPAERAKVEELRSLAAQQSQVESQKDAAITQSNLVREQIQYERQKADIVRNAYREEFQLARQIYDLRNAYIDVMRQQEDYERAIGDYRLAVEDRLLQKRQELARDNIKNAEAEAEVRSRQLGLRYDRRAFDAGPGREADVINAEKNFLQTRIGEEAKINSDKIETELAIDALKMAQRKEDRQWESERIQLERQRDAVLRARVQYERQLEDYKMKVADYQLEISRRIVDEFLEAAAIAASMMQNALTGMGSGTAMAGQAATAFITGGVPGEEGAGRTTGAHLHNELNVAGVKVMKSREEMLDLIFKAGRFEGYTRQDIEKRISRAGNAHGGAIDIDIPAGTKFILNPGYSGTFKGNIDPTGWGNVGDVIGPGIPANAVLRFAHLRGAVAAAGGMPGNGGATGSSNMWAWLRRTMDLETDSNPRPNLSNPRDPVRGALQFKTTTALDAQKRLGISASALQSNSPNVAFPAASRFLRAQYPEAAAAIDAGDYDRADRLMNGVFTSLPGGREARPPEVQARARQFLNQTQAGRNLEIPLMRSRNLPLPGKPVWTPLPPTPDTTAEQGESQQLTNERVRARERLLGIQQQLRDLAEDEALQQLLQAAEGERTYKAKERELQIEKAALGAISSASAAENERADLVVRQTAAYKQAEEINNNILNSTELQGEAKDELQKALERNLENLRKQQAAELGLLETAQKRARLEFKAAGRRELEQTGVPESLGLYGQGKERYQQAIELGMSQEEALQEAALGRQIQIMSQIAAIYEEYNRLTDPMQQVLTLAPQIGDAISGAMTQGVADIVKGAKTAEQVLGDMLMGIADSFLQAAQQVLSQWMVIQLFELFSPFFRGSGDIGAFGNSSIGAGLGSFIPGRAKGGSVAGNHPYIVGEKGPELFVPRGSGEIVSNDDLAAGANAVKSYGANKGGGGDVNTNVSVSINNEGGVKTDSSQGGEMGRMIERAVIATIQQERRPGGLLNRR